MENPAKPVRDAIVRALKKDDSFKDVVAVETDGIAVALADIALPTSGGGVQSFRITVVPQNVKSDFD